MVASSFGLVQLYRLLFWAMHIFDPLVSGLLGCALSGLFIRLFHLESLSSSPLHSNGE
ncbi:MAG: hypothetical protein ACI8T1_002900 [Verrucomicrobiales bacterium]|jgi:hypothetical protein